MSIIGLALARLKRLYGARTAVVRHIGLLSARLDLGLRIRLRAAQYGIGVDFRELPRGRRP